MKTKYKYIHFEKEVNTWWCINNKTGITLGFAEYYKRWKEWIFEPHLSTIFNDSCLRDVADFLSQLNKSEAENERKSK